MRPYQVLPALLAAVIAGVGLASTPGCSRYRNKPQLGEVDRLPRLETLRPEKDVQLALQKTYTATVAAFEKADLCAQVRGVVKSVANDADIGRAVKRGDVLITLSIPDLIADRDHKKALWEQSQHLRDLAQKSLHVAAQEIKEAQATEKRWQAEGKFRDLQYERMTKLAKGDTVAQQLVEEARMQHDSAQAALGAAKAQVLTKQARYEAAEVELKVATNRITVAAADLARTQAMVDFGAIRAPFDGVITKRWVDHGATIKDPGMPLLTIMRMNRVRVILDIPERDVPYLIPEGTPSKGVLGNPVVLHIPALRQVTSDIKGTVTLVAAALDPMTRTMRTEVHLPNPRGLLRPEMTGTATVLLAERKAVTVPSTALVRVRDALEVYYLANPTGEPPRGVVKALQVQIGLDDGQRVEILAPRLSGQELIIRKGNGVIRVGEKALGVPAKDIE